MNHYIHEYSNTENHNLNHDSSNNQEKPIVVVIIIMRTVNVDVGGGRVILVMKIPEVQIITL